MVTDRVRLESDTYISLDLAREGSYLTGVGKIVYHLGGRSYIAVVIEPISLANGTVSEIELGDIRKIAYHLYRALASVSVSAYRRISTSEYNQAVMREIHRQGWRVVDTSAHKDSAYNVSNLDTDIAYDALQRNLGTLLQRCDALLQIVKDPVRKDHYHYLSTIIQTLNDEDGWSREEIADWLESLDIDLEISL